MISPLHRSAAVSAPHVLAASFQNEVGDLTARYFAAFDLLGRAHVILAAQKKTGNKFRLATTTSIPKFAEFDDLGFESLPFTQAIDRVLKLIGLSRDAYDGLAQKYRQQAFTVAGLSDVKLIEQIKQALADTLQEGGTQADFQRAVDTLTDEAGVNRLATTQINTVFQTAVQSAYQAGRLEQMSDPAVTAALPYWTYRTAGDDRVRITHQSLDGFTARYNDLVWAKIYPPCGYNCRCTVTPEGPEDIPEDSDLPGLERLPLLALALPDFSESSWR